MLPGDPSQKKGIILLFDEPSFYFYDAIFPHLQTLQLRALLTVYPRYILETTQITKEERLKTSAALAYSDDFFAEKAPFCTWNELREMTRSGYVEAACGSYSKMNLTFPFVDLNREVILSKEVMEEKLGQAISSFIFPFGKKNAKAKALVSEHYTYALS